MPWTTKRNKTEKLKRFFQFMKENSMVTLKKITYVAFYIANIRLINYSVSSFPYGTLLPYE